MSKYTCIECGHLYTEADVPNDHVCKLDDCPGDGLTGLCIEQKNSTGSQADQGTAPASNVNAMRECGLCVLLMDASGSMFMDPAFKDSNLPSQYGKPFCSKAEIVSKAAAQAIFELRQMTKQENAYVCAIKFDHGHALMFNDTVEGIISKHQTATNLARYFYDELEQMQGGTNINGALNLGYSYVSKFIEGTVPNMNDYQPIFHSQFLADKEDFVEIPNVRIMVYTDGEQLSDYGEIANPFAKDEIDLLLGAYIGDSADKGSADLKKVIGQCPIHGENQFISLDEPSKIPSLRGFFRMASGTSGFCQKCLTNQSHQLR